jgi:hypothetical protein
MTGNRISRLIVGTLVLLGLGGLGLVATASATAPAPNAVATTSAGLIPTNFWLASAQGNVWNFGKAVPYGSAAGLPLAHPIVGITPTPDGGGYWLVASDGGIFSFGDAKFGSSLDRVDFG